jgi:ElaB/YqjD/DUF883 family membrane-anchored ribosome-binding protein
MTSDLLNASNPGNQEQRDKVISDLQSVVSGSGEMLKNAADSSVEALSAARDKFGGKVNEAREQLAQFGSVAKDRAASTADRASEYVRAHPWQSVGAVAIGGLILGLLLNRRHF